MKYAVIEYGGKQYIAREGETFEVDRMSLDPGKQIVFKDVLLLVDGKKVQIGKPLVTGVSVKGKVEGHIKGKKLLVFKYRPKQRYRRRIGHRQQYTRVQIDSITARAAKKETAAKAASEKAGTKTKKASNESTKPKTSSTAKKPSSRTSKE